MTEQEKLDEIARLEKELFPGAPAPKQNYQITTPVQTAAGLTPEEEEELALLEEQAVRRKAPKSKGRAGSTTFGEDMSAFGTGLKYSAERASRGLTDAAAWLGSDYVGGPLKQTMIKHGLAPSDEQLAASKQATEQAGGWGTAGQITGDIGTSVLPAAKLSQAAAIGGKAAPFLSNVATDLATTMALTPDEQKKEAAISSALGTSAGKVLAKTLGGPMRGLMTDDAKKLMDADIGLSPGQMVSGTGAGAFARAAKGAEDVIGAVPIAGAPIKSRQIAAVEDYNKRVLNDIVEPLGGKITKPGREGVEEAQEIFTKALHEATPNLYVDDNRAAILVDNIIPRLKAKDATFNDRVSKTMRDVIETDLTPIISRGNITGEEGYQLGKKLDYYVKKYQRKLSPEQEDLHKGFSKLRDEWYDLLEPKAGSDPAYGEIIQHIQKARRKWYNFRDAAEQTPDGIFTPAQVRKANRGRSPDEITDAAYHILPQSLPKSNLGLNAIIHKAVTPRGISGGVGLGVGLGGMISTGAGLGAAALLPYTKTGGAYLGKGVTPAINALLRKANTGKQLTPEELEFAAQILGSQGTRATRNQNVGD